MTHDTDFSQMFGQFGTIICRAHSEIDSDRTRLDPENMLDPKPATGIDSG